jgi:hypothetical protein
VGDLQVVAPQYGRDDCTELNNWCDEADVNESGSVNLWDLILVAVRVGTSYW